MAATSSTEKSNTRKIPQLSARKKWMQEYKYLRFNHNLKMTCSLCTKFEDRLKESCSNYTDHYVRGSDNYRKSTVAYHFDKSE